MPRSPRAAAALAAAATFALATTATFAAIAPAARGEDRLVLTVGVLDDADGLDPAAGTNDLARELQNLRYARLTGRSAEDLSVLPGLAEAWTPSPDGLTYTYTLRTGLTWSDGKPLTARDVVHTLARARGERWPGYVTAVENLRARARGRRTVVLTSSVPDPRLPALDVPVVRERAGATGSVGAGPFTLVDSEPGQSYRLEANRSSWVYRGGEPIIDEVVFRVFDDGEEMIAALKRGDIGFAHGVPTDLFPSLEGVEQITPVAGNRGAFTELSMNVWDGNLALRDVRVRRAIARAVDRDTLVARVLDGFGSPDATLQASLSPRWSLIDPEAPPTRSGPERSDPYRYDPEAARATLERAGYRDSDGNGVRESPSGDPVLLRLVVATGTPGRDTLTKLLRAYLRDVGVETEMSTLAVSELTTLSDRYDLLVRDRTTGIDPDRVLASFTCGSGRSSAAVAARWCSDDYDPLYRRERATLDSERRETVVRKMLRILKREVPATVLYAPDDLQAYRSDRWADLARQPSETGAMLFTATSPSYVLAGPAPVYGADLGRTEILVAVVGTAGLVMVAALAVLVVRARRRAGVPGPPAAVGDTAGA